MATALTVVQNDTARILTYTSTGGADFSIAVAVNLFLRRSDGFEFMRPMTVTSATTATYQFVVADLAIPGLINCEVQVTESGGFVLTSDNAFQINVRARI